MEDTNHIHHTKRRFAVFIVLLVAFLLIGLVSSTPRHVSAPQDSTAVASEKKCYIWSTEAGDKATLSYIVTNLGDVATGSFNYVPAEKDKKTGDFNGTISPSKDVQGNLTIHGWWNASAEGTTNKEEIIINVGDSIAAVGFGEMKLQADGSYMYADPNNLSYQPPLQRTDCTDAAL
jgi:hypothetical protein